MTATTTACPAAERHPPGGRRAQDPQVRKSTTERSGSLDADCRASPLPVYEQAAPQVNKLLGCEVIR